jgi:hypothetical protein
MAYVIAGYVATIMPVGPARAKLNKPTKAEDTLAAKINCQDFQKSPDGKWTSSSNAKIGKMDFSSHPFGGR